MRARAKRSPTLLALDQRRKGAFTPAQQKFFDLFFRDWPLGRPVLADWWTDFLTHFASPYDFNPLNVNPLRDHLVKTHRFREGARLRGAEALRLPRPMSITGKIAVFERHELTADHVMASACLPFLFQAVEIDGVPYWDGGYMGNPALFPLFYETGCAGHRRSSRSIRSSGIEVPAAARDIQDRLNEITFNGALMGELRAIDFVNRLIDDGKLSADDYVRPLVHRIDGCGLLSPYDAATKLDASWQLITNFFEYGRKAAKHWLDETSSPHRQAEHARPAHGLFVTAKPDDYAVVLTACGVAAAGKIAETLVSERLAACVQKLPVESTYRWKGEIETAQEVLLLIKIKNADYITVEERILALHDYETPEIIALPVAAGFAGYLSWVDEAVRR